MSRVNLTALCLRYRSITAYLILCVFFSGIFAYAQLGRMENPDFTIRQMVVSVAWPGATAPQMQELVLDKIERKLQETPFLKHLRSHTRQGQAVIFVTLQDSCPQSQVRSTWREVRNLVNDMRVELPSGVQGPFFNDRFDDVFGTIYAVVGDDYSYEQKRAIAESIRRQFLSLPTVKRVDLLGVQTERISVKIHAEKLATLGISFSQVQNAISAHNSVQAAGVLETEYDTVHIRIGGMVTDVQAVGDTPVVIEGRTIHLRDIASIERSYVSPTEPKMLFNGQEAVGIAVSMDKGGDILQLRRQLQLMLSSILAELPLGVSISPVADQGEVVANSTGDFIGSIAEALVILLVVSFLSLGVRTGLVVSLCIPLVFAGVFVVMRLLGIDLQVVSLGTLIVALGLLVDDEVIAVEMMSVKLEEGLNRHEAACSAYRITAIPMLSGTLITCAGFIPIGFAGGQAAEFTAAIFPVLAAALLFSWLVSVTAAPLIGYYCIKPQKKPKKSPTGKIISTFSRLLDWCLEHKKTVILITVACFFLSLLSLKFVKKEFFPPSTRGELLVDIRLPDGVSLKTTEAVTRDFIQSLQGVEDIVNSSCYTGQGAPRFVTSIDPVLASSNIAQCVILAKDTAARDTLHQRLLPLFAERYPQVQVNIKPLKMGPPSPFPVMLRVRGTDIAEVRRIATAVAGQLRQNPNYTNINFDWNEKSRVLYLDIDHDRLAALHIDRPTLAATLQRQLSGTTIGEYYEGDRSLAIVFSMQEEPSLAELEQIPISLPGNRTVLLSQLARVRYAWEEPSIWRRNLLPTITVQVDILSGTANDAAQQALDATGSIRENLPYGYSIEPGGTLEESKISSVYLMKPIPVMVMVIVSILMLQLQRFSLTIITLLTAPLGMIGISLGLLLAGHPLGFVAQIGIIALSGMLIRNSVILIDQIESHIAAGQELYQAITSAVVLRFRPIMLTALTSIFAMVPLMKSTFWGPLAVSVSGGLLVGTVLTLLVLPCLYAAWFRQRVR